MLGHPVSWQGTPLMLKHLALIAGHLGRIVFFVFGIVLVEILLCFFPSVKDCPFRAIEIARSG